MTPYEKIKKDGISGLSDKARKARETMFDMGAYVLVGLIYRDGRYQEIFQTKLGQTIRLIYHPAGGFEF